MTDHSTTLPAGFITIEEAAARHNLKRGTAYNRADLGISLKIGGRRLVHADGLDALQRNDTGPLADAQALVRDMRNTE